MIGFIEKDVGCLFADQSVVVADRNILAHENKFKNISWPLDAPPFSETEAQERIESIHKLCQETEIPAKENVDWASAFFAHPLAWYARMTLEHFPAGELRPSSSVTKVVIFPPSPSLTMEEYWNLHLPKKTTYIPSRTAKRFSTYHELDHGIRPLSPQEERNGESAFLMEARADCFALDYGYRHGNSKKDILDWIAMRRVAAFFDYAPPKYWTAEACERDGPPSFAKTLATIRELQVRTIEDLYGYDLYSLDAKGLRRECNNTVGFWENGAFKRESIWTTQHSPFYEEFKKFSSLAVIEALDEVAEKSNKIAPSTYLEGKKIVAALRRIYPCAA